MTMSIKCWCPGHIRRTPQSCWTICWRNMTRHWGRILEVRLEGTGWSQPMNGSGVWSQLEPDVYTAWRICRGNVQHAFQPFGHLSSQEGSRCEIWGHLVVRVENALLALFMLTNAGVLGPAFKNWRGSCRWQQRWGSSDCACKICTMGQSNHLGRQREAGD